MMIKIFKFKSLTPKKCLEDIPDTGSGTVCRTRPESSIHFVDLIFLIENSDESGYLETIFGAIDHLMQAGYSLKSVQN